MIKARIIALVLILLCNTSLTRTANTVEHKPKFISQSISEIQDNYNVIKIDSNTFQVSRGIDVHVLRSDDYKFHSLYRSPQYWSKKSSKINSGGVEPLFAYKSSDHREIKAQTYQWNHSGFESHRSDNYIIKNINQVFETLPCKKWGYWDSNYTPNDAPANLFRCYLNHDCDEGIKRGNRLAILLNDFNPDDSKLLIRQRLQNWNKHMSTEITEATEFIILEDEPRHKGFSIEQLESMVEIAKEEIGDFNFTFSFMRRSNFENILPENLDVVWINFYPFYRKDYYPEMYTATQEEFNNVLSNTVTNVRKKIPNARIILTGQAFYDDHYRKPPIESARWYYEFIQKYDYMLGAVWYQWRDFKGTGTKSMPALYNDQKQAFEQNCKK